MLVHMTDQMLCKCNHCINSTRRLNGNDSIGPLNTLDHYHQLCQPWFLDWELYLRRSPPFISSDRSSLRNLAQIESNARNKHTNKKFNNHTNKYKKNGSRQKTLLGKLGPGPNCPEPNLPGTTKKSTQMQLMQINPAVLEQVPVHVLIHYSLVSPKFSDMRYPPP